ncbi:MAG: LptA/OstA family protein [Arsenophonus sp.]|nr:MAG: LptA/OstA family protein [Arsenophonus sp.]
MQADYVTIIPINNNFKEIIMKAYGKPVKFFQNKPNHIIKGSSNTIIYNTKQQSVIFDNNVIIKQLDNYIISDRIIYSILKNKIQALSKKNKLTRTTLFLP